MNKPTDDDTAGNETPRDDPAPSTAGSQDTGDENPSGEDPGEEGESRRPTRPTSDGPASGGNAPDTGSGPALPDAGPSRGAARHGGLHQFGVELRLLREEIDGLRRRVGEFGDELHGEQRRVLRGTTGHVAEMLPRLDQLEEQLADLLGRAGTPPGDQDVPAGDDGPAAGPSGPVPTPSAGWDDMDRAAATAAWEALARFVGETLHAQYRLTRLQIPDCWPLHPRMVREIAWLRADYLVAKANEGLDPSLIASWHIRSLTGFLKNTTDAVDQRECRPGVHRLTEPEVDRHLGDLHAAREAGAPAPEPSSEAGPDRPALRPEHFPARTTSPQRSTQAEVTAPRISTLPDLLVGSCAPTYWLEAYREASAADIATRS